MSKHYHFQRLFRLDRYFKEIAYYVYNNNLLAYLKYLAADEFVFTNTQKTNTFLQRKIYFSISNCALHSPIYMYKTLTLCYLSVEENIEQMCCKFAS